MNDLKRRYNEMRHACSNKAKLLQDRSDELRQLENAGLTGVKGGEHPFQIKHAELDNKLTKTLGKVAEHDQFRKTYLHIIKRLKMERRSFESQLNSVMESLRQKEVDLNELVKMSNDAARGRELARGELSKLERTVMDERRVREKELGERRKLVQAKIEMNQRVERRERRRREVQMETVGQGSVEAEQGLIKNYVSQVCGVCCCGVVAQR